MKNTLLTIVITLMMAGSLCAVTDPILAANAAPGAFIDESSFLPQFCSTGNLGDTNQFALLLGDRSVTPVCAVGKNSNNDQLQLRAGDGSPMPVCQPGRNCNNDQVAVTIVL